MIDHDETPAEAAMREVEEETGWRPARIEPLLFTQPTAGIMDSAHHIFVGEGAVRVGEPADSFESTRIEWVPLADVPSLIAKQDIVSTTTMAALLLLTTNSEQPRSDTARQTTARPRS